MGSYGFYLPMQLAQALFGLAATLLILVGSAVFLKRERTGVTLLMNIGALLALLGRILLAVCQILGARGLEVKTFLLVSSGLGSVVTVGWIVFGIGFLVRALAAPEELSYGNMEKGST